MKRELPQCEDQAEWETTRCRNKRRVMWKSSKTGVMYCEIHAGIAWMKRAYGPFTKMQWNGEEWQELEGAGS